MKSELRISKTLALPLSLVTLTEATVAKTYVSKLRGLELVTGSRGRLRASDEVCV